MAFIDELTKETSRTTTENGGASFESTTNACLDLFALGGAQRNDLKGFTRLFAKAYLEDKEKAVRIAFYLRDIRGGQGERAVFRQALRYLYDNDKEVFDNIVSYVPEYGRWDDIIEFYTDESVQQLIKTQWEEDLKTTPSLLAKWLPSHNASSKKTCKLGYEWAQILTPGEGSLRQYRHCLTALRRRLDVLEQKMSNGEWDKIDYSHLPSLAISKHGRAFTEHDNERFREYLASVNRGERKINTSTLYTYDVFDVLDQDAELADTLWKNLPVYTQDNALVVADVSGSMLGRPMSISVSLALYFAERNAGVFHNKFMTFSYRPQLVSIVGNTLEEKMRYIQRADWGMNTNIEAVFDTILKAATASGATQEDLPKVIYIISDMQFDACVSNASATVFEKAKEDFQNAGYQLPTIVFWNVSARDNAIPVISEDKNVVLISGSSQSTFGMAVAGKSPTEMMNDVINSDRYANIKIG